MNEKQKRVVIYIPEDDHRKLKSLLVLKGKTVSSWIREVIKNFLKSNQI